MLGRSLSPGALRRASPPGSPEPPLCHRLHGEWGWDGQIRKSELGSTKQIQELLECSWLKCPVRVGRVMMTLNKSGNLPTVAGAFTPLWSAEGGLPGPAFMPGFRSERAPNRASPKDTIPAAFCRARNHPRTPRIDSASSPGPLGGHAVPRPSSAVVWSSTRAQARAYKAKGRKRPSVRVDDSLNTNTNPAPAHDKPGRAQIGNTNISNVAR